MKTDYNGWTNKETWLVKIWYMDTIPDHYTDMGEYHVEPNDLEESVRYIAEECEAFSKLPAGLLSDFISTCWAEVNWHELADSLNDTLSDTLSDMEED